MVKYVNYIEWHVTCLSFFFFRKPTQVKINLCWFFVGFCLVFWFFCEKAWTGRTVQNLVTRFPRIGFLTSFTAAANSVQCCSASFQVRGVKINPFFILFGISNTLILGSPIPRVAPWLCRNLPGLTLWISLLGRDLSIQPESHFRLKSAGVMQQCKAMPKQTHKT